MDAADWLLGALAAEGVTHLFGNPGSTELPLVDALGRQERVRYVLGLNESAVMGMADGFAQASGRMAAVNVHVQPGIANAMAGILNASRARVPLLVTVGQQVTGLRDAAPFLGGEVLGPVRPWVRWCAEVEHPRDLPAALAQAVRAARTPPCGPVVLSLPMDVMTSPPPPDHTSVGPVQAPPPPSGALDAAAALLAGARSPVVLAGDGVAHEGAHEALAALAARLAAAVWSEPQSAGVSMAWGHPLWRGQLPPFAAQIRPLLDGHDVVLALGMPAFRVFGHSPGPALPDGAGLVHVDVDPEEIGRTITPRVGVVGSVAAFIDGVLDRLGAAPAGHAARLREVADRVADARRRAAGALPPPSDDGVGPTDFARAVAGAVAPGDLLVDESLTSGRALRTLVADRPPGGWMAHRGSALGWGLPAAVGAKLAHPGRRVMALQGDGSLLFGVHALWTAAAQGAGLALVVADNGGYEILRAGMEGLTGRPQGDWPGLAIDSPRVDAAAVCAGFGASTARASHADQLPEAMRDLWRRANGGPAVLVVDVRGRTPAVGYPLPAG